MGIKCVGNVKSVESEVYVDVYILTICGLSSACLYDNLWCTQWRPCTWGTLKFSTVSSRYCWQCVVGCCAILGWHSCVEDVLIVSYLPIWAGVGTTHGVAGTHSALRVTTSCAIPPSSSPPASRPCTIENDFDAQILYIPLIRLAPILGQASVLVISIK